MRYSIPKLIANGFALVLLIGSQPSLSGQITSFSYGNVVTYGFDIDFFTEIIINENPAYIRKDSTTDGSTASESLSYSGDEGTASAQSEASLATGTLKAKAQSKSLDNTGPFDLRTAGFARADFGDSFRTFDGTSPFQWNGEEATFSIDLSGFATTGAGVNSRADVSLFFQAFTPGFLDSYAQWLLNDAPFPSDIAANRLFLGDYSLAGDPCCGQTVVGPLPTTLDISFTPGGDFDWVIGLLVDTAASVDDEMIGDFFSTAEVSYSGPDGTTAYSASGVFPNTLDLADAPTVPVPGPAYLLALGLGGLAARRLFSRR